MGFGVALGGPIALGLLLAFLLVLNGKPAGIAVFLLAVPFGYGLIRLREMRLAADETSVATRDLFGEGSCRKEDLAGIRLRRGWHRSPVYAFVRKDGSEAFRTDASAWRRADVEALAVKLGISVQRAQAAGPATYVCPVCGYPRLHQPPLRDGVPSHEICPSCGFEFVVTDGATYAAWRDRWVKAGMPWWAKPAGQDPPLGWDPAGQIKSVRAA
jgi:predicted RNA-binding Zn-ribbon protein involved in translation (DUF1610 family)